MTYGEYLKIKELLSLQQLQSDGEHDETLFIIIHQVYELWFKQIHHESGRLIEKLTEGDTPRANSTLKRILTILKVMVSQVDILETMTPLDFHSFRSRLQASSGFQSFQFRAFEFLLGKRSAKFLDYYPDGSDERLKLEKLMAGPNLFDHFLIHLKKQGYAIPDGAFSYNGRNPSEVFEPIHETLFQLYKTDPLRTQLCELMIDLDEGVQEWRYRHVKMVERTIGMKMGTGGSPGSAYLRQTLFASVFPDLWAIRDKF